MIYIQLLLVGLASARITLASGSATPVREYDAVCAKCHREIYASYLRTPMANASALATDGLIPGTFLHAKSGIQYQVSRQSDAARLTYRTQTGPFILQGRERLDYSLGSGHLGLTYLYSKNNYLLESPIAFYANLKAYDMKPGLTAITHMPGALPVNSTCLRCHMSAVQRPDPGTENRYRGRPFLQVGITCESCHGETREHVATGGAKAVLNPIKLESAKRDSICIVCHLEGATSVERAGRSALDFKPGENIADYVSYFAYARENTTHRGVSEIEQFTTSRCKRASGAGMSCMNCHDPHSSPAPEARAAFYRGKCLACHTQPKYADAHFPANPDCVSCHMPKLGANNIPHVAWTDHRILRHPVGAEIDNASAAGHLDLLPILLQDPGTRDIALAYYNLAVNGAVSEKARAAVLLATVAKTSPGDVAVLRALGVLSEWNGDSVRAEELYRAVLAQDPDSLAATTNLGVLLAKSGNLQAAAALWRPAFARNEDIVGLGQDLARVECMLGQKQDAIETLGRVLLYSPDVPELLDMLSEIESQPCPAVRAAATKSGP